jgi:hypothetical protein
VNDEWKPEDIGYWKGADVFVFDPPLLVPDEGGKLRKLCSLDFSQMAFADDINREDILHALAHPVTDWN